MFAHLLVIKVLYSTKAVKKKKKCFFSGLRKDLGEEWLGRSKEGGTGSVFAEQIFGLLLDGLRDGGRSLAEVEENQAAFKNIRVRIRLKGNTSCKNAFMSSLTSGRHTSWWCPLTSSSAYWDVPSLLLAHLRAASGVWTS